MEHQDVEPGLVGDLAAVVGRARGHGLLGRPVGPSAGALNPLEVYVATEAALRRYSSAEHRADRHVQLEAGHACQNLLLETTALGLGAVPIGAFSDDALRVALGVGDGELPLYVVPVGHAVDGSEAS